MCVLRKYLAKMWENSEIQTDVCCDRGSDIERRGLLLDQALAVLRSVSIYSLSIA